MKMKITDVHPDFVSDEERAEKRAEIAYKLALLEERYRKGNTDTA